MPAYLLAEIEIQDPDRYQEYVRQVPATIEAYGGRYLARGGRAEALEGNRAEIFDTTGLRWGEYRSWPRLRKCRYFFGLRRFMWTELGTQPR